MDGLTFFQNSAGKWRSQRTTHHLPFRRAETGGSEIKVETLNKNDPKIVEICQMHSFEPELSVGGSYVTWDGAMQWDKENEDHKGETVFALIPATDNPRQGKLLRERGYAEIVPVAGEYYLDHDDALVLTTEYETMTIHERFWFVTDDIRMRTSTVKRFGGFNTATFCIEVRETPKNQNSIHNQEKTFLDTPAITGW
ncbi:phycoerythrin linker protein CpeS homolog [Geminocystis sp. NIES-3708]|uniref:phycobiliprotein lyase n=1 Tax=Geminocystis sp. NIES-3708 TaxID=1615909 RepID=UPI0005FC992B|nr:phycobiliprotein lyase [Geminocystis sp. NIES-3708]BAQ60558.1 phycoerythrin linker protein CpeS homolog [Geminocystis sp. NIES-3708]